MAGKKYEDRQNTPDVTVVIKKGGKVINGTDGVMEGLTSELGKGKLGYMTLGK